MMAGSRLERILVERADRIVETYAHFLVPGDSWLSVGDGDGYVSLQTQRRCGVRARGLDLAIDWPNRTELIPIDHYGGRDMPYEEDSFDVVSAIFTLHHCDDVHFMLSEMVRVARKKIVICEDVYRTWLGRRFVCLMDKLENRAVSKEINLPFNFKRVPEWEALFRELGLSITTSRGFKIYPRFPVRHHVFCLEV